jgi:hypothetical protein
MNSRRDTYGSEGLKGLQSCLAEADSFGRHMLEMLQPSTRGRIFALHESYII